MDFSSIGGPLISAGASLIGAKMTSDSSAKAARLNAIAQANADQATRDHNLMLRNEQWTREDQLRANELQIQKEFAMNGIRWKADDARAAGIHPAFALGAQTSSYSSNVGNSSYTPASSSSIAPFTGSSMGSGIAQAGQDISRALQATRSEDQRADAYTKTVQDLTIQKMGMENALLASQLSKVNQGGGNPSFPSTARKNLIDGQGNTPSSSKRHKIEPMESQYSAPKNAAIEPGQVTETGHTVTRSNDAGGASRWSPVQSDIAKDRLEEDMIGTLLWTWRNRIMPTFGGNYNPPNVPLKKGKEWLYHPLTQEYLQVRRNPQPEGSRLFRRR